MILLESDALQVTVLPERGATITSIASPGDANILWNPDDADFGPAAENMPPPGPASAEVFERAAFAGGWFPMFPTVGPPGQAEDVWLHGEAPWLRWQIAAASPRELTLLATTPATGLQLTRHVRVSGSTVTVRTDAMNSSVSHRWVAWGEHPCFSRDFFAGGSILLRPSASRSASSADPLRTRIPPLADFVWPRLIAPDVSLDFSLIPEIPDGREEHILVTVPAARATISAPQHDTDVELRWSGETMPFAMLWQHFAAPSTGWDVFALEPTSSRSRTHEEATRDRYLAELAPGRRVSWSMTIAVAKRLSGSVPDAMPLPEIAG